MDLKMKSECKVDEWGTKRWYLNGKLHREDGPAIEWKDGAKFWHQNGLRHREDGPAVECSNGDVAWHFNGKCHRIDGPAVEYVSGTKYWYINGKRYTFKEWLDQIWDTLLIEEQERYIFNGFEYAE